MTVESLRATFGSNQVVPVFLRKKTPGGGYADHIVQTPVYMPAFLVRRGKGGAMKSNVNDLSLARIIDFGRGKAFEILLTHGYVLLTVVCSLQGALQDRHLRDTGIYGPGAGQGQGGCIRHPLYRHSDAEVEYLEPGMHGKYNLQVNFL